MSELYRVMKPGGWGIFQIPQDLNRQQTFADDSITDAKKRAEIFGQYDHVRIYGRDYFDKLRAVGFQVQEIAATDFLSAEEIRTFALQQNEILPVCSKAK